MGNLSEQRRQRSSEFGLLRWLEFVRQNTTEKEAVWGEMEERDWHGYSSWVSG